MDKAKPQPQKNHKRIVDLDTFEFPESSFYLAVRCFGKVWEPTKVERMVLKLYNAQTVDKDEFWRTAKYVNTRMSRDWNVFCSHVISIEAFGHIYKQTQTISEMSHNYCKLLAAYDEMARRFGKETEPLEIVANMFETFWNGLDEMKLGICTHAAFLYAVHQRFQERGVPLYLYPFPLREDFRRLNEDINLLQKELKKEPKTAEQLPPFNWDGLAIEHAGAIITPQRNALIAEERNVKSILNL
jgi:hypothetical protein